MFLRRQISDKRARWLLLGLMLLGFGLRILRLGDKSVWWDEGLAVWAARQSLTAIARWTAADVHPPLYFWLLHFWRLISGDSEFGLRLFSAMIGLLTIPATYLLGKRINGRFTGLLAALLMTISRFDIGWSQEMRMYGLAALLAALALWAAVGVWQYGRLRDWLLYILFMLAGLYNLYLSVMVLVAANLVWLLFVWPQAKQRWHYFWRWSLAQTAVLLLYAPWLTYALGRIPTWSRANVVEPWSFLKIYWTVLTVGIPLDVERYAALTLPLLFIFLLGIALISWQARRQIRTRQNLMLLLIGLLLPALVIYIVSLPKASFFYSPPLAPRYLIIFLAAFTVLLAWGIDLLGNGRRWPLALFAAGMAIYVAWFGLKSYHPNRVLADDFPSLTATIAAYQQPDDAVVLYTDTDWPIFAYHYANFWYGIPSAWQMTPQQANEFLMPIWQEYAGIWLVKTQYAPISDPEQQVTSWLEERAVDKVSYPYGDKVLIFYARTSERAAQLTSLIDDTPRFLLDTAVSPLMGYDLYADDYRSGETVRLFLYWNGNGRSQPLEIGVVPAKGGDPFPLETLTVPNSVGIGRQQVDLLVSPDLASGEYNFYAETDAGIAQFGQLNIRQGQSNFITINDVTIQNRVDAAFNEGISLLGFDLGATSYRPGDAVLLTLYWQTQGQISQRYKVFTHVLGDVYNINSNNFLWGQQDNEPKNGRRPTTTWRSNEIIVDSYTIPLDSQTPPGVYQIEIGLYNPITGERLLVRDGSNRIILITIRIE